MSKRNPFRTLERVGNIVANAVAGVVVVLVFGVFGYGLAIHEGWGWWTLLLIPGLALAAIVIMFLAALLWRLADWIHDSWLVAKWRWDDRHPEE